MLVLEKMDDMEDQIFRMIHDSMSLLDLFQTIVLHLIEKHLKGLALRFGRRRMRSGFQEIRSNSLLPPDLRQLMIIILFKMEVNLSGILLGCLARASVQRASKHFISQTNRE